MALISRKIVNSILPLLAQYPIVALTGPRQSGKTTLLKNLLPNYKYVSLENLDERSFAKEDPKGFLKKYHSKVIFDEVQRSPHLFSYLQTLVDEKKEMGQFVLSGSQNFHLLKNITQSLAGRVAILKLLPFDIQELKEANLLENNWKSLLFKGFYPAIYDRKIEPSIFYSNYLQTYINRDVADLTNIHDNNRFNNFLKLCAARTGQLLNLNDLAKDCGISQPTAKSWLSILESSYIVFLLHPYFENFSKRIVKAPKLYFYDLGLVLFLLGFREEQTFTNQSFVGNLFENLVLADLFKKNFHQNKIQEHWFWRDSNGNEIDILTKEGNQFNIFEIKSSETILPRFMKGINYFDKISNGLAKQKTLIYGGKENQIRSNYQIKSWQNL